MTVWDNLNFSQLRDKHDYFFFFFFKVCIQSWNCDYFREHLRAAEFWEAFLLFHVFFLPLADVSVVFFSFSFFLPQCGQHVSGSLQRAAHLQLT